MHTFSRRVAARSLGTLPLAFAVSHFATSNQVTTAQEPSGHIAGEFVGVIALDAGTQPDILVALIAEPLAGKGDSRSVRAYFCNGDSLAEWFAGESEGNAFSITSKNGATLEGELSEEGASGTFSLADGGTLDFGVQRAAGIEGLYHLTQSELGSFGASSRGILWQYGVDEEGHLEGIFVQVDGTIEPISVMLPPSSLAPEDELADADADTPLTTNRLIVVGKLPEPRVAGTMVSTRKPCRFVLVTTSTGQQQWVSVCN